MVQTHSLSWQDLDERESNIYPLMNQFEQSSSGGSLFRSLAGLFRLAGIQIKPDKVYENKVSIYVKEYNSSPINGGEDLYAEVFLTVGGHKAHITYPRSGDVQNVNKPMDIVDAKAILTQAKGIVNMAVTPLKLTA